MKRLTIFAKGNLDVRDSLHSLRIDGEVRWNGINAVLRERASPLTIRVRHETSTGSEALLAATGQVPTALDGRTLSLDAYPLAAQYGVAMFEAEADACVLSIQPDVQVKSVRHRRDGFLFYPENMEQWPQSDLEWLRGEFFPDGLVDADKAMASLEGVIERLRAVRDVPILIYNISSVIPGETLHCHEGMEDSFSTRIRRFNLALIELSQRTGISIVDVDRIVATGGAAALKYDATHLTARGCRAVAEEVLRILEDVGCIPSPGDPG